MSKKCARCEKTVYPIEELKCLDKVWHKQCFKCQSCNMVLNMRNYKGFDKNPYCEAHIPKAKATSVAVTPEFTRIAENTKLQSNVKYHAEFEKSKGKLTQVADDPETLRIKQNSQIISNVAYHGDLKKKAAMEQKRNLNEDNNSQHSAEVVEPAKIQEPVRHHSQASLGKDLSVNSAPVNSPYTARQTSTVIYTSERGPVNNYGGRAVGSIADFDPVNNYYGSLSNQTSAPQYQSSHQKPSRGSGRVYRAMYDYDAQDRDEVSFLNGDIILDCVSVDSGWMTGVVQRTGELGMLPANYVTPAI